MLALLRREAGTSTIAQAGAKVLEGLLSEEGQKRIQHGLPAANEDFSRNNSPENDAPTFREVVERIASVSKWQTQPFDTGSVFTQDVALPDVNELPPRPNRPNAVSNSTGFSTTTEPSASIFASAAPPVPTLAFSTSGISQPESGKYFNSRPISGVPPSSYTGFGDAGLGGDESEDLLRNLGFFEVGTGLMPSMPDGTSRMENTDSVFGMLGGNGMAQDLSWLDGLGEW